MRGTLPAYRSPLAKFDRYVDQELGDDSFDGRTPATAWKTMAKLSATSLLAGTKVGLRRGRVWREKFTVPSSGGPGNLITIGAYGSGPQPELRGSVDRSGLSWSVHTGAVYVAAATGLAGTISCAWVDGTTKLTLAASVAAMTAGSFYPDSGAGLLYVWLPDSTSPTGRTVETANPGLTSRLLDCLQSYVSIEDIAVRHAQMSGGVGAAVWLYNASIATENWMRRCTIADSFCGGVFAAVIGGGIEYCAVERNWPGLEYPAANQGAGITVANGADGMKIHGNRVGRNYRGIFQTGSPANTLVTRNLVYLQRINGIDINGAQAAAPTRVFNNTVWHRTGTGVGHGLTHQVSGDGVAFKNNAVFCDGAMAPTNMQAIALGLPGATVIDVDYNAYHVAPGSTSYVGRVGSTDYSTLAAFIAAMPGGWTGRDAHSITAAPQFVDLPGLDVTPGPSSPLRNAGIHIPGVTDGYLGAAPDIGAIEAA